MVKWVEIKPLEQDKDRIKFEATGQEFSGVLTLIEKIPDKKHPLYHFATKDGEKKFFGTNELDKRLMQMEVGTLIKITYLGERKDEKTGHTTKLFKAEVPEVAI